ncbi:MAG: hypothetical protein IT539_13855 [Bradyrhizobiaceae bacterium]|nr:hypothetical protein [Bradyrhizobiaceae bacterium]
MSKPAESIKVRLPSGAVKEFTGRVGWTLAKLIAAGSAGISSGELPAGLRLSHYIFRLRREGVGILAEREQHGGEYAGTHARYRLGVVVQVVSDEIGAAA